MEGHREPRQPQGTEPLEGTLSVSNAVGVVRMNQSNHPPLSTDPSLYTPRGENERPLSVHPQGGVNQANLNDPCTEGTFNLCKHRGHRRRTAVRPGGGGVPGGGCRGAPGSGGGGGVAHAAVEEELAIPHPARRGSYPRSSSYI